jgi:hypothetical protein
MAPFAADWEAPAEAELAWCPCQGNAAFNVITILDAESRDNITKIGNQSRFRKFAQDDKWNFCLTADTLCPANQERP